MNSSPSRTTNGMAAQHILNALLIGLAISLAAFAQTGVVTELPGLVPPAVAQGTAAPAGPFSATQMLRLVFGLRHPHMADEEEFLEALHTKGSPDFMHFLTADEWNARFSPSPEDEQAVVDWAQSQGFTITQRFANRLLVDVEAPVSVIEAALGVKINSYAIGGANYFSNDRNPAVPAALGNIIHSAGGLNNMQVMKAGKHGFAEGTLPAYTPGPAYAVGASGSHDGDRGKLPGAKPGFTDGLYDPNDMASSVAYDVGPLNALGHCCNPLANPNVSPKETSIAIVSVGIQDPSDIAGFQSTFPYLAYHYQEIYIDGTPGWTDDEGTEDLEWATAMANSFGAYQDTAMIYMYDASENYDFNFTDAYNHALSDSYARVLSTSWGVAEFDGIPQSEMDTDHGIFNSMIGQGWTLVSNSGDGGATAWDGYTCTSHDSVAYPGSDPDMVSAGGSALWLEGGPQFISEVALPSETVAGSCNGFLGGSGGGNSAYYVAPSYMGLPSNFPRQVPDIALNAYYQQATYFQGQLGIGAGTEIAAPEVAAFFAQANAYLLYIGEVTGGCSGKPCAPLGNGNVYLYYFGLNPDFAAHYPFYDITSGCNNNDVTAQYGLIYFCAGQGRDQVTGWGSFNFLQLAWAINTYRAADFSAPVVTFAGPTINRWYNTDEEVIWAIKDTTENGNKPVGVAGYSQAWDSDPGDVFKEATPGSGNSFYSGPQFPNANGGCLDFTGASGCSGGAGQGWHRVYVRAWDNTGIGEAYSYGPIGYDNVPPHTTGQASTTYPAQVTLTATDATSGVASTVYQLDGATTKTYSGPFPVTGIGSHKVTFHSTDNAGNVESTETLSFSIEPTTTAVTSSVNPSQFYQGVAFTATVKSGAGTPGGTITFFNGTAQIGVATLSGGKASLKPITLQLGNRSITAVYSGSASFSGSTSPVFTQTVNKANTVTTLTASPNPSKLGQPVTFTATVTGDFGGSPLSTVTFQNVLTVLGTGTLNASTHQATFTTSSLTAGTTSVHAVYGGNVDFNGSSSPVWRQSVQP